MSRKYDILSTPEGLAMLVVLLVGIFMVTGVLVWMDRRRIAKQHALLRAFAERFHFECKPGDKASSAPEDTFEALYQGWRVGLGMRQQVMSRNGSSSRPTLHVELGLELPRDFEAFSRVWERTIPFKDRPRCFEVGTPALDERFVWLCARAEQPRAQALLRESGVQRALMALGAGCAASVRIEKNRVELIIEHALDEAALQLHLDALVAVAKALRLAVGASPQAVGLTR